LIDACYDREIFPTLEQALDWCWAKDDAEIAAVKFVLTKFFTIEDGIYVQDRIREEIANYHNNAKTNKEIAIERERKRREAREGKKHEPCTVEHESPPNQEPLTINQEPLTIIEPSIETQGEKPTSPPVKKENEKLGELICKNGVFEVYEKFWDELADTYPNKDLQQEFKRMKMWLITNEQKRKTVRGMPRFINKWLSN